MSKEQPLWHKLYFHPLYIDLARAVGYVGFPVCELAERLRPLARQHGAKRLSAAFADVLSFAGNRVMLSEKARRLCSQLLGPPPEEWDRFYRHPDGQPKERPPGRETPPVIPEREIDPITDGLRILAPSQLEDMLKDARRKRTSKLEHIADLARQQVPRVESEMLRRGMEIPEEPRPAEEAPKKRTGKKKAS